MHRHICVYVYICLCIYIYIKHIAMHVFQFTLHLPLFPHLVILIFLFLLSLFHRVLIKTGSWAWNMFGEITPLNPL